MIDSLRPAKHRQSSPRRNTVILQNLAPGFTLLAPVECYVARQDSTRRGCELLLFEPWLGITCQK